MVIERSRRIVSAVGDWLLVATLAVVALPSERPAVAAAEIAPAAGGRG